MKNSIKYLFLFSIIIMSACSSDDPEPTIEKEARIEIDLSGDFNDYIISFGVNSLIRGTNEFVKPNILEPSTIEWDRVIADSYYIDTIVPDFEKIIVESEKSVHTLSFLFMAVYNGGDHDESLEPLKATIRVIGNGAEVKKIEYVAPMPGLTNSPIQETIKF